MTEQSPNVEHLPNWARIVYFIGVPSALVLFLTWFITNSMYTDLRAIQENLKTTQEDLKLHSIDSSYITKETLQIRSILQKICANTAANRDERNKCFE